MRTIVSHETVAIPSTYSFINIKPGDDYKNREIHREGSAQFFNDVSPGLAEAELLFWLIHFWFYATKATDNMCNKGSGIAAKPRGIENVITITAYGSSISLLQWLNRTKPNNVDSEISTLKGYYVSRSLYCYCKSHHGHRHVVELSVLIAVAMILGDGVYKLASIEQDPSLRTKIPSWVAGGGYELRLPEWYYILVISVFVLVLALCNALWSQAHGLVTSQPMFTIRAWAGSDHGGLPAHI
ncbi:hypothetical protein HID58_009855 [Brassica napus]|uniref:Uncharacterized protein n=1 Tax=Brassica napus TaxID=3708 RepID=A0ABQ8DVL2_BRANA|nr:hypothetical protein HID58_009855 [Brassica napus]